MIIFSGKKSKSGTEGREGNKAATSGYRRASFYFVTVCFGSGLAFASIRVYLRPIRLAAKTSVAFARIQMRNRARRSCHHWHSNTMPHNILQQSPASLPTRSLRKIRDLIIYRENQAQMRIDLH
jgi:hypothetical protein